MIGGKRVLALKNPRDQRAGFRRAAADRRIDGRIDGGSRVCRGGEAPECQIVVPRQDGQLPVLLVQVVVVHHHAGIAVVVAEEIVHRQIADNLVGIDHLVHILALVQLPEGLDQPLLIALGHIGFGVIEDIAVAVRIVVRVNQLHVLAAHTEGEAAKAAVPALAVRRSGRNTVPARGREALGHLRSAGGFAGGTVEGAAVVRLRAVGRIRGGTGSRVGFGVGSGGKLGHVKVPPVAPSAAKGHAVRLVQLAAAQAVALHECVLHALHGQIQPPRLTVHVDLHIAAQRGRHARTVHQRVGQIVLHHGCVLNQVVQAQLVQPVIGHVGYKMVKFHLEGVSRGAERRHRGQGGVALGADGDMAEPFTVDDDVAVCVLLRGGVGDEAVPVLHDDVDGMHRALVKQPAFVAERISIRAPSRLHAAPQQHGYQQHYRHCAYAESIQRFCFPHGITPYSRRCSSPAPRCSRRPAPTAR